MMITLDQFKQIKEQGLKKWQEYEKENHLDDYKKKKFEILSQHIRQDRLGNYKVKPLTINDLKKMPSREERLIYEEQKNDFLIKYYLQYLTIEEILKYQKNAKINFNYCEAVDRQCSIYCQYYNFGCKGDLKNDKR